MMFARSINMMREYLKLLVVAGGILIAFQSSSATAQDSAVPTPSFNSVDPGAAELKAARALVDVILPPEQRKAMANGMIQSMMQNLTGGVMQSSELQQTFEKYPSARGVVQRFIEREEAKSLEMMRNEMPVMIEAMSRAYARSFTVDQLAEMNAFFSSPTGQVYVTKSMAIMSDPDVAQWQGDVMKKSMEDMPATVLQLMTELKEAIGASDAADTAVK